MNESTPRNLKPFELISASNRRVSILNNASDIANSPIHETEANAAGKSENSANGQGTNHGEEEYIPAASQDVPVMNRVRLRSSEKRKAEMELNEQNGTITVAASQNSQYSNLQQLLMQRTVDQEKISLARLVRRREVCKINQRRYRERQKNLKAKLNETCDDLHNSVQDEQFKIQSLKQEIRHNVKTMEILRCKTIDHLFRHVLNGPSTDQYHFIKQCLATTLDVNGVCFEKHRDFHEYLAYYKNENQQNCTFALPAKQYVQGELDIYMMHTYLSIKMPESGDAPKYQFSIPVTIVVFFKAQASCLVEKLAIHVYYTEIWNVVNSLCQEHPVDRSAVIRMIRCACLEQKSSAKDEMLLSHR